MVSSTRHFLGVMDAAARSFLAQGVDGSLAIARGYEVDRAEAEDRGVGRSRIEQVNRIYTAYDGFGCPILTTDDADEAEASLHAFGYRLIECTERLYDYAAAHGCSARSVFQVCNRTEAGLLDIRETKHHESP